MFPNGYNMPFYPSYNIPRMGMGLGAARGIGTAARGAGLFSRLGGLTSGIRSINWQGLLNNTSRTLGVINQAIPIVKQVGPMYNNMKSMIKLASLFKDETDQVSNYSNTSSNSTNSSNKEKIIEQDNTIEKENTIINKNYSNSPNFFI